MADSSSKTVVYAALGGNLLVAVTKGVAAAVTGSSSMLSEAVHSFVDSGNELLLLYGMHRSQKQATPEHPIGHGRELYFWSFIVAVLIFSLGAGVSIFEGLRHIREPQEIESPLVNYVVLALAFVFEGVSWVISLRQYRSAKGDLGFFEAFRKSKDPPSFMVFFEDSAALVGIVLAAAGTWASTSLDMPVLDGWASIAIGVVLAVVAVLLARESKSLLIGERADRALSDAILRVAAEQPGVARANGLITVQMAPDQIVAALSLEFADELCTPQIEQAVTGIEARIKQEYPEVVSLFIKPQTLKTFQEKQRALEAGR